MNNRKLYEVLVGHEDETEEFFIIKDETGKIRGFKKFMLNMVMENRLGVNNFVIIDFGNNMFTLPEIEANTWKTAKKDLVE